MAFWPKEKSSECHRPMVAREGGKKCIPTWIEVVDWWWEKYAKIFHFSLRLRDDSSTELFFYMVKIVHELLAVERIGGKIRNPTEQWEREREWVSCCRVESTFWISMAGNRFCHPHNNSRDSPWFSMQKRKAFCKVRNWKFLSTLSSLYLCDAVSALAALSAPWKYGVCEGRNENLW